MKKTYFVADCNGNYAGHDMTKVDAETLAERLQAEDPEAEWEMMDAAESEEK